MSRAETGDRILVSFIGKPIPKRFDGNDWPYHVTLLPWYEINEENVVDWHRQLESIAAKTKRFSAVISSEDNFGVRHNILVGRLAVSAFRPLHFRLLNTVTNDAIGGSVRDERFMGNGYKPHITQKYEGLLPVGHEITINSFSEVAKISPDEQNNSREVIRTFPLT